MDKFYPQRERKCQRTKVALILRVTSYAYVTFSFLVGVKAQSRIRAMQPFEPRMFSSANKVKTTDPGDGSIGYETMTTLSDYDSAVSMFTLYQIK